MVTLPSAVLARWFEAPLVVDHIDLDGPFLRLDVTSTATSGACPSCKQPSTKLHSRYTRVLHDLPFGGMTTVVHLKLHRFRCREPGCHQHVFCERLLGLAVPYAKRTARRTQALVGIASVSGGRGGARLGKQLGLSASASRLIRCLEQPTVMAPNALRYVGIDDFAFRRGHTCGTVIVDLETHRPVEILPDRTTKAVEAWLRQHPEITLVTRDRSTEFTCAILGSLPKATQVLDRRHVLKNLREVLERFLGRHQKMLREATPDAKPRSKDGEEVRAQINRQKSTLLIQMQALRRDGLGTRMIARRLGVSRYLVKRYLQADAVPARRAHTRVRSILDPYLDLLDRRWDEGCRVGSQLLREIRSLGYTGTRHPLDSWLRPKKAGVPLLTPPHAGRAASRAACRAGRNTARRRSGPRLEHCPQGAGVAVVEEGRGPPRR